MRSVKLLVISSFVLFTVSFFFIDARVRTVSGAPLGISLGVPTGVEASDGDYSTKVGLHWDTIRGATVYRVFRNTTNSTGTATDLGTTAANYFFDTTAAQGQTYFYWVRAENLSAESNFSIPDPGLRANGTIGGGPFSPLEPPAAPAGNAVTAAKAYLGKALFWDEQMSSTRTVACGTCHRPAAGGSDPRTAANPDRSRNPGPDNLFGTLDDVFGSPGVPQNNLDGTFSVNSIYGYYEQVTGRKAPSYLNGGYAPNGIFWDGRASNIFRDPLTSAIVLSGSASLESQSTGPPVSGGEMGHTGRDWTQVAVRIQASRPLALATNVPAGLATWIAGRTYPQLFEEAFGTPDVTPSRIAMAIATHERTLFSDRTPLDRAMMQIEPLTAPEDRGLNVFTSQQCNSCHAGALLSDNGFHNVGVRPQADDAGRFAVTGDPDDKGRFKTPSLRNLELRGPYMHNGGFRRVEDVVAFYNRGGDFDAPNIDHGVIFPLTLPPDQRQDLAAFLKRPLTDTRVRDELPPFDRPTLFTESNRVPSVSGRGRPGSKRVTPEAIVIEPPIIGNPNFTVAIAKAMGGAQATLVIDAQDPGLGMTIPTGGAFAFQTTTLSSYGLGQGYGSISVPIPDQPSLIGQTFYGRWYVRDLRAIGGFSVSRLFSFTIF